MELKEVVEARVFSFRRVDRKLHLYAHGRNPGELTEEKVETTGLKLF